MASSQHTKKVSKQRILRSVASSSAIEVGLSTREIELRLKSKENKFNQLNLA